MNATVGLLLFLMAPGIESDGKVVRPEDVAPFLAKAQLEFERPLGFRPTFVRPNQAMEYDLALRAPDGTLEVRYAVRLRAPEREAPGPTPTDDGAPRLRRVVAADAKLLPALAQATVLNISGGEMPELRRLDPQSLARDFGADEGLTAVFPPKAPGWTGHSTCMMLALRKAGAAELYVFFLFDDFERSARQIQRAFDSLRFADTLADDPGATPTAR